MGDLIEQLEKATGPDRELDRMIEETLPGALRHPHRDSVRDNYVISGEGHSTYSPGQGYLPAHYTASIDAALTLVPEGREWRIEQRHGKAMRPAYASVWSVGSRDTDFHANGDAKTPAIALCIAALKARAAVEPRPAKLTPQSDQRGEP